MGGRKFKIVAARKCEEMQESEDAAAGNKMLKRGETCSRCWNLKKQLNPEKITSKET